MLVFQTREGVSITLFRSQMAHFRRKRPYRKIKCDLCTRSRTGNRPVTKEEKIAREIDKQLEG